MYLAGAIKKAYPNAVNLILGNRYDPEKYVHEWQAMDGATKQQVAAFVFRVGTRLGCGINRYHGVDPYDEEVATWRACDLAARGGWQQARLEDRKRGDFKNAAIAFGAMAAVGALVLLAARDTQPKRQRIAA